MTKVRKSLRALSLLLTIPSLSLIYTYLNNPNRGAFNLVTSIDRSIPFIKGFIIPYAMLQIFIGMTLCYFCFYDRKNYYTTLVSINICLLVCYLIYFFFPTTVPRPVLTESDWLTKIVQVVYQMDPPFNCFPSIHCLTSGLMIKAAWRSEVINKKGQFVICCIASLIIVSTLFVKQHVVLDVIGAFVLGNVVFEAVNKIEGKSIILGMYSSFALLRRKVSIKASIKAEG